LSKTKSEEETAEEGVRREKNIEDRGLNSALVHSELKPL
jgi:hypothetical protein